MRGWQKYREAERKLKRNSSSLPILLVRAAYGEGRKWEWGEKSIMFDVTASLGVHSWQKLGNDIGHVVM